MMSLKENPPVTESRRKPRFILDPPIAGSFGSFTVNIYNIGENGVQVEHKERIARGSTGELKFLLPFSPKVIRVAGTVAWCRVAKRDNPLVPWPYRSGLRVSGIHELTLKTLGRLLELQMIRPDTKSMQRKKAMIEKGLGLARPAERPQVDAPLTIDDCITTVQIARNQLRNMPDRGAELARTGQQRWNALGGRAGYRDEVLAIWEQLHQSVEPQMIALSLDLYSTE